MNNNNIPAWFGALAFSLAAPASAGLYRCGNVFQDRPCELATQEAARPGQGAASAPRRPASGATADAHAPAPKEAASAPPHEPTPPLRAASAATTVMATSAGSAPVQPRKGPPSLACGNLREQHVAIEARLRAGGRPPTIEMYQRQLHEVEKNLEEGNCY